MKSQMLHFLRILLADAGSRCHTSTHLDFENIEKRVKHEGDSFVTITLPRFAKAFQLALDKGQVDLSTFAGFASRGQLPILLGGLLDQVFDRGCGRLLSNPSITAIQAIRQITMAFGKIRLECSVERTNKAILDFVECERDIRAVDSAYSQQDLLDFRRMAHLLWREPNSSLDRKIYYGELIPAHGPGATADRLRGNQKFTCNEWTLRLEQYFPYLENAIPSYSLYESLNHVDYREPGSERPVRVTCVPKTLDGPRVIAIEPTCMMFVQQAILNEMKTEFRSGNAFEFICFDSQVPNQQLAKEGSTTGRLATLDLKEASDRVSNLLVKELFYYHPHLREAVDAARSRSADVPGFGVIPLAKFASMGSGLTFPIEAMVFTTLVFLGIQSDLNRPLTQRDLNGFFGSVRVYGDDIIIPVEFVNSVIRSLEHFGARVNTNKSFWTGKFRESCGEDFYAGQSVKVARVRKVFPESRKDAKELAATVALRNQLHELGYEETVAWLDLFLSSRKLLGQLYPYVTKDSAALGRHAYDGSFTVDRMHVEQQRPQVRAYVVSSRIPKNKIDGYPALLKVFLKLSEQPFEDVNHLERSGRPSVVDIKQKWVSP